MAKKHFEESHIKAISKTATAENQIIIFREVGDAAKSFKENGVNIIGKDGVETHSNVASKDMRVKAKSAGKGAFAGLIPVNAINSKIGDKLRETKDPIEVASLLAKIKEADEKTQKAIKSGELKTVTAVIDGKKMEVLADEGGNPFTADYDMLTHTTHNKNKSEDENQLYYNKSFGYTTKSTTSLISSLNTNMAAEDVKSGKITAEEKKLAAGKYKQTKTTTEVAHGADFGNPNPDILSITPDRPLTVFTPAGDVFEIKSNEEFVGFAKKSSRLGYKLPANKGWGIEFEEGTVDYVDTKNADKNKDLGFANNKSAEAFWNKELDNLDAEIAKMGKLGEGTKNKSNNVLALNAAKYAVIAELNGDNKKSDKLWKNLAKLNKRYKNNNEQEISPVGKLMAKRDILAYHQACLDNDPKKIEQAAYNITYGNESTYQIYKQSVNAEMINETIKQGQKHHHRVLEEQKASDKSNETDNNKTIAKGVKSIEYTKYMDKIVAQKKER